MHTLVYACLVLSIACWWQLASVRYQTASSYTLLSRRCTTTPLTKRRGKKRRQENGRGTEKMKRKSTEKARRTRKEEKHREASDRVSFSRSPTPSLPVAVLIVDHGLCRVLIREKLG